jgi:pleckstrin homology domain-containing family G member 4
LKVGAAFLRHEPKFYLYALYNKNKPKSDSLMSEYGSSFFKPKQIELKDKMDLASYLLKPVQRMGKYALLLQQLMKACSNIQCAGNQELIEDLDELQKAEEMVRFQLRHGNDLLAMDSLRDCDVKEQGRLLRQNEFLVWEGRGGKKSLRQVFLFEELVLFSKARRFPDRKVSEKPRKSDYETELMTRLARFPTRTWTSTSTKTASRRRTSASRLTSAIPRQSLRSGSASASPATLGPSKA